MRRNGILLVSGFVVKAKRSYVLLDIQRCAVVVGGTMTPHYSVRWRYSVKGGGVRCSIFIAAVQPYVPVCVAIVE
jgi:hypothetical protein